MTAKSVAPAVLLLLHAASDYNFFLTEAWHRAILNIPHGGIMKTTGKTTEQDIVRKGGYLGCTVRRIVPVK